MGKIKMFFNIIRSIIIFIANEYRRGTLKANLKGLSKNEIKKEMSWAELLEEKADKYEDRIFLTFRDKNFTYRDMDDNANKISNFFIHHNSGQGKGVAMLMDNSSRFIDIFIGIQKNGMYSVPVNTSLRGDSLLYILNHCEAQYLVLDEIYLKQIEKFRDKLENIKYIIVNFSNKETNIPDGMISLDDAYSLSSKNSKIGYKIDEICLILYTSGTTGLPKGVVYRYKKSSVKLLSLVAHLLFNKNDVMYTAMKLFHGNALFVTVTCAIHVGARVVLMEKFSASKLWDEIRKYDVTTFNTIGAMIPIIMKQPEKPSDSEHKVRFIISAACPTDLWEKFEKRYNLKLFEAYGAVDGGGKIILNLGTDPVGSIGKPSMNLKYRLVNSEMNDVPEGSSGELIFASGGKGSSVEYFKNEEASNEKSDSSWIFTGDLMKKDKKGYLYFIGRNSESMRIKGENVSAFQVEQAIQKHPDILEAAVYAVPSELAEDEIMASISTVQGKSINEIDVIEFIREDLPKFAVPRFIKTVKEFPKTETFRIKKNEIEELGIVDGTYDTLNNSYI